MPIFENLLFNKDDYEECGPEITFWFCWTKRRNFKNEKRKETRKESGTNPIELCKKLKKN